MEKKYLYTYITCAGTCGLYLGGGAAPRLMLVNSRGGEKGLGMDTARRTDSSGIPDTKHCPSMYVVCRVIAFPR
jgi:hypothetical protein